MQQLTKDNLIVFYSLCHPASIHTHTHTHTLLSIATSNRKGTTVRNKQFQTEKNQTSKNGRRRCKSKFNQVIRIDQSDRRTLHTWGIRRARIPILLEWRKGDKKNNLLKQSDNNGQQRSKLHTKINKKEIDRLKNWAYEPATVNEKQEPSRLRHSSYVCESRTDLDVFF